MLISVTALVDSIWWLNLYVQCTPMLIMQLLSADLNSVDFASVTVVVAGSLVSYLIANYSCVLYTVIPTMCI